MIPVVFQHDNHMVLFYEPGYLNFALYNPLVFQDGIKVTRINLKEDTEQGGGLGFIDGFQGESLVGSDEKKAEWELSEDDMKVLRSISGYVSKVRPQIWGFSPSKREIPLLTNLMILHGVPLGEFGKNPAPARGKSYHKEFMEAVWNAAPFVDNWSTYRKTIRSDHILAIEWADMIMNRARKFGADVKLQAGAEFVEPKEGVSQDFANVINALRYIAGISEMSVNL